MAKEFDYRDFPPDRFVPFGVEPSMERRHVDGHGVDIKVHRQIGTIDQRFCTGHMMGNFPFGPPTHG